ncbi:DUF4423 domain-containing protein [Bdellovibrio sp. BCCA]|uniref:DUF4423 domain-containing protein n=1 Tax=Bdellovibrio sp. BCCA TaxID=3136281 RepID=UPI0030F162C0
MILLLKQMKRFNRAVDILKYDYESRRQRNPRFSKRSYAKFLGISSGRLADLMNERIPLSEKMALLVYKKLDVTSEDQEHFLNLVRNEQVHKMDRRRKINFDKQVIFLKDTKKSLEEALKILESGDTDLCDFTSVTVPVSAKKLDQIRVLVRQFQFNLAALAHEENVEDTYCLSIQLVPTSRIEK